MSDLPEELPTVLSRSLSRQLSATTRRILDTIEAPRARLTAILLRVRAAPAPIRGDLKDLLVDGRIDQVDRLLGVIEARSVLESIADGDEGPDADDDHDESGDAAGGEQETKQDNWTCARCHRDNTGGDVCAACECQRVGGGGGGMTDVQIEEEERMWACPRCHLVNPGAMALCATCEFVRVDESGAAVEFSLESEVEFPPASPSVQVSPAPRALMLPSHENLGAIPLVNDTGVCFRVWAPNAAAVFVAGEFAPSWKDWRDYPLLPESEVVMAASDQVAEAGAGAGAGTGTGTGTGAGSGSGSGPGSGSGSESASPFAGATTAGATSSPSGLMHASSSYGDLLTASKESANPGFFSGVIHSAKPGMQYKYVIVSDDGRSLWRNDPAARELVVSARGVRNSRITSRWGFGWTAQDWKAPPLAETVLYEMHVGSFTAEGTFAAAAARLDHVVELGASGIELMPVSSDAHAACWGDTKAACESGGCCARACWGYDVLSLFSVHSPYGTADDLKALVDAAHNRGLAVVVDWVPNHLSSQSFLANFDGIRSPLASADDPDQAGPYLYPGSLRHTPYGPRFDCRSPHVRNYIVWSALTLLDEFRVDGLRVDSTQTLRRTNASHGPSDLSGDLLESWTLMQELTVGVRQRWGASKYLICEDMCRDPKLINVAGFDADWDLDFYTTVFRAVVTVQDSNRDLHALRHAIQGDSHRVIFTESHDTVPTDRSGRLPEAIQPGGGPYAVKRALVAAVVMLTSPGLPMLCAGQELLELRGEKWPVPMPFPLSDADKPPSADAVFHVFARLTRLRRNTWGTTAGLSGANVGVTHVNTHHRVIVWRRWVTGGAGDDVVVVVNLCSHHFETGYVVGVPRAGTWHVRMNTGADPMDSDPSRLSAEAPFSNLGLVESLEAEPSVRDELPASLSLPLGPYCAIILSQDPPVSPASPPSAACTPGWAV